MCGELEYHCALVDLLTCCTEGKNYNTEIKCHGLLPLDDITQVMNSDLCLPKIKQVYSMFLVHCYIDTESEMKEVYNSRHIWHLFNHFTKDIQRLLDEPNFPFRNDLTEFVSNQMPMVIREFLASKFWDATAIAGDSLNEEYFRRLAATYVEYCKMNKITFRNKPHIAEMLRIMQQKVKIARVEVNNTFEEDLKSIIEDKTMTKVATKWKFKLSSRSRQASCLSFTEPDAKHVEYQNILDGFQASCLKKNGTC
jgi:hypothetical protein